MADTLQLTRPALLLPGLLLEGPEVPADLSQALQDFGLMDSFRQRARSLQCEYVRCVAAASGAARASRIAEILDELALTHPLSSSERTL